MPQPTTHTDQTGGPNYRPTPEVKTPDSQKSSEKDAGQKHDINTSEKYGSPQDEDVTERPGQESEWQTPGQDTFPGVENTPVPPKTTQAPPTENEDQNPSRRWL